MSRQPVQVLPGGEQIRCCFCRTDEWGLPDTDVPISPNHWGVRFRESPDLNVSVRGIGENRDWRWNITFEGEPVSHRVFEFESGVRGWVALYYEDSDGNRKQCRGPQLPPHALVFIERGIVTATKVPI